MAQVKIKGFTDSILAELATDPVWSVVMQIMMANQLIKGNINRDGNVGLDLFKFNNNQVADLLERGLEIEGRMPTLAEFSLKSISNTIPVYLQDKAARGRWFTSYKEVQVKDETGKLLFTDEIKVDEVSGEETTIQVPVTKSEVDQDRWANWSEISEPKTTNDGTKVSFVLNVNQEEFEALMADASLTVLSVKDWKEDANYKPIEK